MQNTQEITKDYAQKYNSNFAQVAKAVAPAVANRMLTTNAFGMAAATMVNIGSTAVQVGLGLSKANEAMDDFNGDFALYITRVSSKAAAPLSHMENVLENSFAHLGSALMQELTANGLTQKDISNDNCAKISEFNLKQFADKKDALINACQKIAELFKNEHVDEKINSLNKQLQKLLLAKPRVPHPIKRMD